MSAMTGHDETDESQANLLCTACGLCCTGHLFIWAKLRPSELDPAEELGMTVFRSDPTQRGFSQPCPLWQGHCTIYDTPRYPHVCRAYKCKLLKEVMAENTSLSQALTLIEQAKGMIQEMEALLPGPSHHNFRERLVAQLESPQPEYGDAEFQWQAEMLLTFYAEVFGVNDLVERDEEK